MRELYSDEDYEKTVALKKKMLTAYFAVLGGCVIVCGVFFTLFLLMPYTSTATLTATKNLYMFIDCAVSVLFAIFSFVYLCIPYRRVKYYLKMLDGMMTGEKLIGEGTFLSKDENLTEEYFVEYKTMSVLEWSDKTQEYMRRNILVDKEKQIPSFKKGDLVVYKTHANILMACGLKKDEIVFEDIG